MQGFLFVYKKHSLQIKKKKNSWNKVVLKDPTPIYKHTRGVLMLTAGNL